MKEFDCEAAGPKLAAFADQLLPSEEAAAVKRHLRQCPVCTRQHGELVVLRRAMRAMPRRQAPSTLTTALRVAASQERVRRARYRSVGVFVAMAKQDARLWFNNLMRPLALPFAGGLMTATLLFSMFASSYPLRGRTITQDVPTPIYTEATFKGMVPLEFASGDVIVDLFIDDQGRVLDTRFIAGDPQLKSAIEHMLLYTEFKPATSFGKPVSGRIRVSFGRGHIDVRG
jgi:hypothetical protein